MTDAAEPGLVVLNMALEAHLPRALSAHGTRLNQALAAAVFPGGKRLRPILTLLGAGIFDLPPADALPAACAVEFVHTASLILDDLPAMDDAATRRGRPSLHHAFGEDMALLAAMALLNQAYAIFGQSLPLLQEATAAIGVEGMIGGQALDLAPSSGLHGDADWPGQRAWLEERNRKSSAMMRLACTAGALACGLTSSQVAALASAGEALGEAYQMADDLLDARAAGDRGKPHGQDARHRRFTCADAGSHGSCSHTATYAELSCLLEESKQALEIAYGGRQSAKLNGFIDQAFSALAAEA